jgi:leucyl/phenylalanyl-tRNA--protein transferase
MSRHDEPFAITTQILLRAYSIGLFPMAESAEEKQLFWVDPEKRAIFPLESFRLSRSLAKSVRSDRFTVKIDTAFDEVIEGCAQPAQDREKTWINGKIRRLYRELFDAGDVHTVECWRDGQLVGGLYGVAIGGGFFGESMFHRETDASKVALAHLVARLRAGGYRLLDTQFMTVHLASLGAVEVPRDEYRQRLAAAINVEGDFLIWPKETAVSGMQALAALAS